MTNSEAASSIRDAGNQRACLLCDSHVVARGYCGRHYARLLRTGTPHLAAPAKNPGWGRGSPGEGRYWTKPRIVRALKSYAAKENYFPTASDDYNRLKKGRLDLPTAQAILDLWPSMARAWLAVGVERKRLPMTNTRWSQAEKNFLLEHAGTMTLDAIARRLNRTYSGVRTMLGSKGMGIKARENQGWLSASRVAKEYGCPPSRVQSLIAQGRLKANRDPHRKSWRIAPEHVERVRHLLEASR